MQHCTFGNTSKKFTTAILIKESSLAQGNIQQHYIDYLESKNVDVSEIIAVGLQYTSANKAPMKLIVPCLEATLKALRHLGVKTLYVADAAYFKKLAGVRVGEPNLGLILPCKFEGYEGMKVMYGVNYQSIVHNPDNAEKLLSSIHALKNHLGGTLIKLGSDIIHSEYYPDNLVKIKNWLTSLHNRPILYADIEAFSLKFWKAGIASIGFSWDKNNGGAFLVDALENELMDPTETKPTYLVRHTNRGIRKLLKQFLIEYKGKIVWHNANYDLKVLVYELFMEDAIDYEGMMYGIKVLTNDFDDTKIIAYLALNRCGAISKQYGLKVLAQQFAGNYAESNINDVTKIPANKLLRYNLVDCLSTAYVRDTYLPRMIADQQTKPYEEIFIPSVGALIKTELVGMPICPKRVNEVDMLLGDISFKHLQRLRLNPVINEFEDEYREALALNYNNTHKVKRKVAKDFRDYVLNPNSGDQVGDLLYEFIGLPIIETTDTDLPSCAGDTLKYLKNHTTDVHVVEILDCILGINEVEKIRGTFIKAFRANTVKKPDGYYYLHGNFNLGGAVSGRLSSSDPNLTNMPSGSTYGKLIKSCFISTDKWIFCGADYNALEATADALWTKDKNKLAIYQGGYDSHSYNTYYYWPKKFKHLTKQLDVLDVDDHSARAKIINTIKDTHDGDRSGSKPVTFALQFKGTENTLVKRSGFSLSESRRIVGNYHTLYAESEAATDVRIKQANIDGYVTVAFGLRVRTPLIGKAVMSNKMPYQIQAEIRTAGNAMSQSYGQLTNRSLIKTIEDTEREGLGANILPCCLIHDAMYWLCERKLTSIKFLNDCVSKHMSWVPPELVHPEVKLHGELDLFIDNWASSCTLKNNSSKQDIANAVDKYLIK